MIVDLVKRRSPWQVACLVTTLTLTFSPGWGAVTPTESDGSSNVNGKEVKAKLFSFDTRVETLDSRQPDSLIVKIDESGMAKIFSRTSGASHLFGPGEVDAFIGVLKKANEDAKMARFTKQAGDFVVGRVGNGLTLTMTTSPGGSFPNYSILMRDFQGGLAKEIISEDVIDGLIGVLSKTDQVVGQLSGEDGTVKIIKLSMSQPGETSGRGGLTLRITDEKGAAIWTVEEVGFKLRIRKGDKSLARQGLSQALQYLRAANKTYEEMPNKTFKIRGLGKPVDSSVEAFDGNGDRYEFTAHIHGDGEEKPRWIVISEDQLAKLVALLGH